MADQAMKLLPCPFCGNDEIDFKGPDGSPFSIICTRCCAEMPYMSLDDPQTERWNTRAQAAYAIVSKIECPHCGERMDSTASEEEIEARIRAHGYRTGYPRTSDGRPW